MRRYQSSAVEVCEAAGFAPTRAPAAWWGAWRNPTIGVRVALAATAWALPGVLAGLLAEAVTQFTPNPASAAVQGAVLGGAVGAWLEARGRT